MKVERISSVEKPMNAKAFKDAFKTHIEGVANNEPAYEDEDGLHRLYIKFLNGRTACLVAREDVDPDAHLENSQYEHACKSAGELRSFWGTVGAAISFNISFCFEYKSRTGEKRELILMRYWDDTHAADEFVEDIVTTVQMTMEDMFIAEGRGRAEKLDKLNARLLVVEKGLRHLRKQLREEL